MAKRYNKEEIEKDVLYSKIIKFFEENDVDNDDMVHAFADGLGIEHDVLETLIYKFVTTILRGGKSFDTKQDMFNENELDMGIEVEYEHVDKTSPYAYYIAKKIAMDHLTECYDYYTRLAEMEKECKNNNNGEKMEESKINEDASLKDLIQAKDYTPNENIEMDEKLKIFDYALDKFSYLLKKNKDYLVSEFADIFIQTYTLNNKNNEDIYRVLRYFGDLKIRIDGLTGKVIVM